MRSGYTKSCVVTRVAPQLLTTVEAPTLATARYFTLFQVAFSLLVAFSTSLEGSVIKMKPAAPIPVDTTVSLKALPAKFHHNI